MTIIELIESQLRETATVVPDPEHGTHVSAVDGLVDVGAIVGLVLEHAATIVDTHMVPHRDPSGRERMIPALASDTRKYLNQLAKEARA